MAKAPSADEISYPDPDGGTLVREAVVLTFFWRRPFKDVADPLVSIFQRWLSIVPRDVLQWATIGANADTASAVRANSIDRCLDQLDRTKAAKRDVSGFSIFGEEDGNPRYRFDLTADRNPADEDETIASYVEMRFASDVVDGAGVETFVAFAEQCARNLPFDSGYASRALCRSDTGSPSKSGRIIAGLALRHLAFDIPVNESTRFDVGDRCRGAYWLTFLGPALVKELGGRRALATVLGEEVSVSSLGDGLMLRAGKKPERGDVNRKKDLPELRTLARALEPVTFFGDSTIENEIFDEDDDKRERWERRFLD